MARWVLWCGLPFLSHDLSIFSFLASFFCFTFYHVFTWLNNLMMTAYGKRGYIQSLLHCLHNVPSPPPLLGNMSMSASPYERHYLSEDWSKSPRWKRRGRGTSTVKRISLSSLHALRERKGERDWEKFIFYNLYKKRKREKERQNTRIYFMKYRIIYPHHIIIFQYHYHHIFFYIPSSICHKM